MSETRGSNKGSVNLDVALREWPEVEKPHGDWDDSARAVMDRLEGGKRGVTTASITDENLLGAPLGQTAEDGHNHATAGGTGSAAHHPPTREGTPMTMPADRERDRRSLQDLAKMAQGLTPPPPSVMPSAPSGVQRAVEAKKDDSGIVDLAAASTADPSAALRAQSTPLASQGLFDDEPQSVRPPPMSHAPHTAPFAAQAQLPTQPAPSIPPMPGSIPPASLSPQQHALTPSAPPVGFAPSAVSSSLQVVPAKKKGNGKVIALVIGGVVALSAAAAGGLFVMKAKKAAHDAVAVAVTTTQPAVVAQAEPPPAPTAADPTPAPVTEPAPEATPEPATHGKIAMAKPVAKGGAAKHEAAPAPAKPEGPAKMTEKDLAAAPGGPMGDLGKEMQKAVGDDGTKATPAAANVGSTPTGNVPQKPSQGAVTGALGAVLPGARACLGPDDPVSRATIIFSSAGTVTSVNVGGAAAGKPAEACIKSALMKAKVQPFAEPTYSANITVRHN
ncbi:MAG: alginate regulatory protein AlgP [Labilithrix sp.]|nr:alginate regulatory protein AlgP [Labilithrix sp.]